MEIKEISPRIHSERQLKAVTGLSAPEFAAILKKFDELLLLQKEQNKAGKIKPDNGNKGKLVTSVDKLLLVLYYLKCYPTFDELGFLFNMHGSNAKTLLDGFLPIFQKALASFGVLPERGFESPEEMRETLKKAGALLIDATERPVQRPQDVDTQSKYYSGKKKDTRSRIR